MDPATALGVASAILTFVTFSTAVLKVGHGVCVTSSGRNEQNMTREVVLDETKAFLDRLLLSNDPRISDDDGLCRLVEESRRIAKKMIEILDKVKPKTSGTVANLRSAIRHTMSQPDMEDLEKRMDQCRSQLDLYLNSEYFKSLRRTLDQMLDQDKLNTAQISKLQTSVDRLRTGITIESLSEEAQNQFLRLISIQQGSLDRVCQNVILKALKFPDMHDRFNSLGSAHPETFRWLLSENDDDSLSSSRQNLYDRIGYNIASASSTVSRHRWRMGPDQLDEFLSSVRASSSRAIPCEDIFREDKTLNMRALARDMFLSWLASSGDSFHICGKLGSGKSTLMKYLLEHERTKIELKNWAGENKQLVCASFFFWKSGSRLQKSLPGLLRSLLHDILAARPELIQSILPMIWASVMDHPHIPQSGVEVTPRDIQIAFENLITDQNLYTHHRFCFFIDGLDEYEETGQHDHKSMIDMLISWTTTSNGNIKLCVSSREKNVFINAFSNTRRLMIHDLTLHDIRSYVRDRLRHFPDRETRWKLVQGVASKADGIFLWATLVVKSIREAIEDGASIADLTALLDSTPPELEGLFSHILKTLDKKKLGKACKTFAMLDKLSHEYPSMKISSDDFPKLRLLAYSFLDDYELDHKFALRDDFLNTIKSREATVEERLQMAAKQLRANCGGLLEARAEQHGIHDPAGLPIDYTHRSVYEFLEEIRNSSQPNLILSDKHFDAGDAASSLILAQIRALGLEHSKDHQYGGLALLRLGAVATPDQESYEFLECIDSLTGEAGLHDVTDRGDQSLEIQLGDQEWRGHRVSFPGSTGMHLLSTSENRSLEDRRMNRPILVAIILGFNDYAAWKLRHDPGVVDSSTKRMVLMDVFSGVDHPKDHPLWDFIFEAGVLSFDENMGFLADVNRPSSSGRWDTTRCAWFSPWRQSLVSAANHVLRHVAISELKAWRVRSAERWGQLYEEFLRRGAADVEMDVVVTPGHLPSDSGRELRIEKFTFRFGEACLAWALDSDGCVFTDFVQGKPTANLDIKVLQWFSDIRGTDIELGKEICITFREYIRAIELPNQDVLFSLLDSRAALGAPTGAEALEKVAEVGAERHQPADAKEAAEIMEAKSTEGVGPNFVLAFGAGVLVSLMVATVWMTYSLGVRGHS